MFVFLSQRLILLYRDISLPVKRVVLWQGKPWEQNHGDSGTEILQHN